MTDRTEKKSPFLDPERIRAFQEGNQEAFTEIYEHYKNYVHFLGKQYFRDDSLAEDLVQEVFLTVSQKIGQLKAPEAFPAWLNRIACNCCHMMSRNQKLQCVSLDEEQAEEHIGPAHVPTPESRAEAREMKEIIENTLRGLEQDTRLIAFLRYYEELPMQEIADIVDVTESTVKNRLFKVRKAVRRELTRNHYPVTACFSFLLVPHLFTSFFRMAASLDTAAAVTAAGTSAAAVHTASAAAKKAPFAAGPAAAAVVCAAIPLSIIGGKQAVDGIHRPEPPAIAAEDMECPAVTGSQNGEEQFTLTVEDAGSGIDYGNIRIYGGDGAAKTLLGAGGGTVTVAKDQIPCSLDIPDKSGNILRLDLEREP